MNYTFILQRSRILQTGMMVLHLLALVAVLMNTLPVAARMVLSVLVLWHYGWYRRQYGPQYKAGVLSYEASTGWAIDLQGEPMAIQILPATLLTPFLIIVHYQILSTKNWSATWVCFKDALPQATFRQLSVLLKIAGIPDKEFTH